MTEEEMDIINTLVGPAKAAEALGRALKEASKDWGFLDNETKEGISVPVGARLIQHHLLLTGEESEVLHKMAEDMDLSTHGVLKQALRVLQMYRAGYLVDNSPKLGGCGACE